MAVQMDKPSELSSRERAQRLYNKNVELENTRRKSAHARIPSDPNEWQQIRENHEAIILEDHSFSEQHEVELALWQLHYKRIEELRGLFNAAGTSNVSTGTQNGKGLTPCSERILRIRSQFKTFLSEATGFYHELMVKIRAKYGLPLADFSDDPENRSFLSKDGQQSTDMKKGLISCHRCLIYLGDLARYKGLYGDGESKTREFAAASSYYTQACSLWPTSGNPYHQLAILAAYQGDEFVAIYRYFRSLAVESPFSTARDNLIIAFERNRQNYLQLLGDAKALKATMPRMNGKGRGRGEARPSPKDNRNHPSQNKNKPASMPEIFKGFCVKFVRVNGILFTRTSLETFADVLSMAKSDFMVLLSCGSEEEYHFGSNAAECGFLIVRLVAILIFTVHILNRESDNQSYADILQRSVLLQNAYTATFEFMGHVVERCLQLQDPLSSYLLPGVLVFVEWLACHPDVSSGNEAGEEQTSIRLCFWNSCITFFNKLLSCGFVSNNEDATGFSNMRKSEEDETTNQIALWEDFELRGFLPLRSAHSILDFSRKRSFVNEDRIKEKWTRAQRIIAAGKAFANIVRIGKQGFYFDSVMKKFILCAKLPVSIDFPLNNGLEMLNLNEAGQEQLLDKKASLTEEEDDEEEVIVFKPSAVDKQAGGGFPPLASCEDLGLVACKSDGDLRVHIQSTSAPPSGTPLQTDFDSTLEPPSSVVNSATHYLQPVHPNTSGWLLEQQASILNGRKKFALMDNLHLKDQTPPERFTNTLSLPFSHTVNLDPMNGYPAQMSEVVGPLKTGCNTSLRSDSDICAVKVQPILPVASRKNPVSRPVRYSGPPPGFTPATSKYDDPPVQSNMKGNPLMDDYSWLDGYQTPASMKQGNGFNISANLNGSFYSDVENRSSIQGATSFPFPGKQALSFKTPSESLWEDYQCTDNLKFYEQQQPKGNQQPISLPSYQGQSLWGSRFLV